MLNLHAPTPPSAPPPTPSLEWLTDDQPLRAAPVTSDRPPFQQQLLTLLLMVLGWTLVASPLMLLQAKFNLLDANLEKTQPNKTGASETEIVRVVD